MASGGSSGDGSGSSSGSSDPSVSNFRTYSPRNTAYGRANAVFSVDNGYAFAGNKFIKLGLDGTETWSHDTAPLGGDRNRRRLLIASQSISFGA